jgi:hypothetical protein
MLCCAASVFLLFLYIIIFPIAYLLGLQPYLESFIESFAIGIACIAIMWLLFGARVYKFLMTPNFKERLVILKDLPVHRVIMDRAPTEDILSAIADHPDKTMKREFDGKTAFELAFEVQEGMDVEVISALLLSCLPPVDSDVYVELGASTKSARFRDSEDWETFCRYWTRVVQQDRFAPALSSVLDAAADLAADLSEAVDAEGRQALNIASPACRTVIEKALFFVRRYEITTLECPLHKSKTSIVHFAVDHEDGKRKVALKFMSSREQFNREVNIRSGAGFDGDLIVAIIRTYDTEVDAVYQSELSRKGFSAFPLLIVMEAGDLTLSEAVARDNFAGTDWELVRLKSLKIGRCLEHLHSRAIVHGDLQRKYCKYTSL